MRTIYASIIAVGLLVTGLSTAHASEPMTHDGFHLQLGAGLGLHNVSGEGDVTISGISFPTQLLMGGTIIPGLVIGGGLIFDYAPSPTLEANGQEFPGDISQIVIGLGLYGDYYLDPAGGLHFQGFLGYGGLETSVEGNVGGSDPTGPVIALGAGYDVFISEQWSVGGLARITIAPLSQDSASFTVLAPSLLGTITWH